MSIPVFHRAELADRMAQQVLATGVGVSASSGLFLAAPRRTGKSTFIREDLRPALVKAGAVVIYVDLWANKQADPGDLITGAIQDELAKYDGLVKRLSKNAGIDKVNLAGVAISLSQASAGNDVALSAVLAALSDEVKAPIALLIDEAQHAITTDGGYAALFALKAARDELNSSAHFGLRIVATGSNRDKLAMLRNSKDQAFFGAPLVAFPSLGKDYVTWFCQGVGLPVQLEVDEVYRLFEQAAFRPELLAAAADQVRFDFAIEPHRVGEAFVNAVQVQIAMADAQTMRVIDALTPLQSSVLRVMAAKAEKYAPFDEVAMKLYAAVIKKIAPAETVVPDVSNVQQALAALQDKGLVWREKRGVYALEESTTAELLRIAGMLDVL